MTITVSISEFRQNLSDYLAKAAAGDIIVLKDNKKGKEIVEVQKRKTFDPVAFGKSLKAAAGVFTAKNHPEGRTKRDVIRWVEKGRKEADREF